METTATTTDLSGVIPPLVTPLTIDGELDVPSLERLLTRLLDAGVDGVFSLSSSGESAFQDDALRDRTLSTTASFIAGQVPVLAGAIDMQTHRVADRIRAAANHNIAGVVVTAPFYAITGPDEVERHFRLLADTASVPVWAYDIPVCVHTKLIPEMLVALGRDGVLAGVKDSSGDDISFRRLCQLNRAAEEPLRVLTGHEAVVDGAYLAGAHGVVPGLGNVDPHGYVRMHRAAVSGDFDTMRQEQDRLARLFEIVRAPKGMIGPAAGVGSFKTALRELGVFSTNTMNEPMQPITGPAVDEIRMILSETDLLP